MTRRLDLADIQGNIVHAYGKKNFPVARYFFLHIEASGAEGPKEGEKGRRFVDAVRHRITTATEWDKNIKPGEPGGPPKVTLNIAFTFYGLLALNLPTRTLKSMPPEFIDGMKARAHILGDRNQEPPVSEAEPSWDANWDPIWKNNVPQTDSSVHIWISMNAHVEPGTDQPVPELEEQTKWLVGLCKEIGGIRILAQNGKVNDDGDHSQYYQAASVIFEKVDGLGKIPTPKEHFGFSDGIGNPVFEGQFTPEIQKKRVLGRGKWMPPKQGKWASPEEGWQPLATGEFLLGHPDEGQEDPPAARPDEFMRNGSFMVYRKLHQNVGSFNEYMATEAKKFAKVMGMDAAEAEVTLKAKLVGRWPDGVPLSRAGTHEEWRDVVAERGLEDTDPKTRLGNLQEYRASDHITSFKYGDDIRGFKCPSGSHLRRVNTRDYLDPTNDPDETNPNATTQLNKRRRILRRGLPYGDKPAGQQTDKTEQGIAFMVICASIFRQFEFVQQQWIQYGLDFNQGNNTCPLLGNHSKHKRHTIPSDPATKKPPYICDNLPQFVETRGGDYFFIPSVTALWLIAQGIIDPT